jgi:hypothetical protein
VKKNVIRPQPMMVGVEIHMTQWVWEDCLVKLAASAEKPEKCVVVERRSPDPRGPRGKRAQMADGNPLISILGKKWHS